MLAEVRAVQRCLVAAARLLQAGLPVPSYKVLRFAIVRQYHTSSRTQTVNIFLHLVLAEVQAVDPCPRSHAGYGARLTRAPRDNMWHARARVNCDKRAPG